MNNKFQREHYCVRINFTKQQYKVGDQHLDLKIVGIYANVYQLDSVDYTVYGVFLEPVKNCISSNVPTLTLTTYRNQFHVVTLRGSSTTLSFYPAGEFREKYR